MSLTLLLPIAGAGSRFSDAGYNTPKPFVDVDGVSMIERSVANLPRADKIVLLCLSDHLSYIPKTLLDYGPVDVVEIERVTAGQACTVLEARGIVDGEMIVADCDQWLDWYPDHFLDYMRRSDADGGMTIFRGLRSHWSYVHLSPEMVVESVVEKVPVSDHAVAGVRYFKEAQSAFAALDRMVSEPVVGEYYLGAVFNDLIRCRQRILAYPVPRVYSLGTPEELETTIAEKPWRQA